MNPEIETPETWIPATPGWRLIRYWPDDLNPIEILHIVAWLATTQGELLPAVVAPNSTPPGWLINDHTGALAAPGQTTVTIDGSTMEIPSW